MLTIKFSKKFRFDTSDMYPELETPESGISKEYDAIACAMAYSDTFKLLNVLCRDWVLVSDYVNEDDFLTFFTKDIISSSSLGSLTTSLKLTIESKHTSVATKHIFLLEEPPSINPISEVVSRVSGYRVSEYDNYVDYITELLLHHIKIVKEDNLNALNQEKLLAYTLERYIIVFLYSVLTELRGSCAGAEDCIKHVYAKLIEERIRIGETKFKLHLVDEYHDIYNKRGYDKLIQCVRKRITY